MEVACIESAADGVVDPIPTLLSVETNSIEVPLSAFVPLKYGTCPVDPLKSDEVAMESVSCEEPTRAAVPAEESPRPRASEEVATDESAFVPLP